MGGRWTSLLPSTFVVLALMALLIVPLFMQRQIRDLSYEIQNSADPARTAVTRIQYLLARQTSVLRGFLISGDSAYLRQYQELSAAERAAYRRLEPLARQLGEDVLPAYRELRARSTRWHSRLQSEIPSLAPGPGIRAAIPFEREDYLATLDAANRFDEAVVRSTVRRQETIRRAEDRMLSVQIGLVAIALLAAITTAQLGARVRRLAGVAEGRRLQAERALAERARAEQGKERLLRGVTHDVKNPLGAADGYAEILELGLRGDLTQPQAQTVSAIRRSIRTALDIISDLLDLSRAESGGLTVRADRVSLRDLVADAVVEHQGAAHAAGQVLEFERGIPDVVVWTDPVRVRQILGNLLSNAIKYTPAGGRITVRLEPADRAEYGDGVAIRVSDTGPGIPAEYQQRIFEEFERVPGVLAGGHGLGLAISQRVAHLLRGEIILRSKEGEGSTFTLWLPMERRRPRDPASV